MFVSKWSGQSWTNQTSPHFVTMFCANGPNRFLIPTPSWASTPCFSTFTFTPNCTVSRERSSTRPLSTPDGLRRFSFTNVPLLLFVSLMKNCWERGGGTLAEHYIHVYHQRLRGQLYHQRLRGQRWVYIALLHSFPTMHNLYTCVYAVVPDGNQIVYYEWHHV